MSRVLAGGLTITTLHNDLLRSAPAIMYMHVGGQGDPVKMAQGCEAYSPQAPRRSPRQHRLLLRATSSA